MNLSIKELDYIVKGVVAGLAEHLDRRDEVIDTEKVAYMLGISRQAVTKRVREGKLPGRRRGKHYYFLRTEILKELTR